MYLGKNIIIKINQFDFELVDFFAYIFINITYMQMNKCNKSEWKRANLNKKESIL